MKICELFETPPTDFFSALEKFGRMMAGYPQGFGFHHDISSNSCRGSFEVRDGRGTVHKVYTDDDDVVIYRCTFDQENLLNDHQRLNQIAAAVMDSAPNMWHHVGPTAFTSNPDPCYTIEISGPRVIDIKVKHDGHEALKHY